MKVQNKTKRADVWACLYAVFFDTDHTEETSEPMTEE